MNHIASVAVRLVSVYKPESEERIQQIFNRIFTQARRNIMMRKHSRRYKIITNER